MNPAYLDACQRDVYLSVDLDYWTCCPEEHVGEAASSLKGRDPLDVRMSRFLEKVLAEAPQVVLTTHHDRIVPYVNGVFECPLSRVINVDFHSDLPEWGPLTPFPALNEGTWGLYVGMPHTKVFEWRTHSTHSMAARRCCTDHTDPSCDPFNVPELTAYRRAVHRLGLRGIPWHRLAGASITVSPDWWFADSETCGMLDTWGMKLSRTVLGLRHWPMKRDVVKVLQGKPVPDHDFQERLAQTYKAR